MTEEPVRHNLGRLQVNRVCNQRCVFCSAPPVGGELPFADIEKRMRRLKEEGTTDLMLTGGEPTLKRDLLEILDLAWELDFEEITIQSNGSTMHNEAFVEKLLPYKEKLKFNISFHVSDERIFGELSQAPHTYRNTLKSLENLGKHGFFVFLTVVIQKRNFKHLKEHIQFVRERYPYITHFSFNFVDPIYNAWENQEDVIPRFGEARPYMHEAFQYILDEGCTFRIEKIPLCHLRGFEQYQSNLRRHLFKETRMNSFYRRPSDVDTYEWSKEENKSQFFYGPQCATCSLLSICPGANRDYVRIFGHEDLVPVKDRDPKEILAKAAETKRKREDPSEKKEEERLEAEGDPAAPTKREEKSSFTERALEDLALFRKAISIKSNNNNVYDTYSFFLMEKAGYKDERFMKKAWNRHISGVKAGEAPDNLSMYIHMPYCKTNCTFCVYPSMTMQNPQQLETYLTFLTQQMDSYAPVFGDASFRTFYMGGGTPSVFSAQQLDQLFSKLFSTFSFKEGGERAIEFNPSTTSFEKLEILKKYGFNKISMGVQSLSRRVLKINERVYQTKKMVEEAIENAKRLELNYINVDLILGLKDDTPEEFVESFSELCRMGPNNICIYPIKTNDTYIQRNYPGFREFADFYYPLFDRVREELPRIAKEHGFYPSEDTAQNSQSYIKPLVFFNSRGRARKPTFSYSHFSEEPQSIFSLGYYSQGRIVNKVDYRLVDKDKVDSMFLKRFSPDPEDYHYDVDLMSPRFERVKFVVREFYKYRQVPRAEYKERYGSDICEDFPYAIEALKMLDVISVRPDTVDFGKKDETFYYPYLLFFVGRENVARKLEGLGVAMKPLLKTAETIGRRAAA